MKDCAGDLLQAISADGGIVTQINDLCFDKKAVPEYIICPSRDSSQPKQWGSEG